MGRSFTAGAALILTIWVLYSILGFKGGVQGTVGQEIFFFQSWAGFCFAAMALLATSDTISSEKRGGTLGLLFLTHLKGRDIVLGKLASSMTLYFISAAATLPILALPVLLGGLHFTQSLQLLVSLLNTMLFSGAAGIFASSISVKKQSGGSLALSIVLGFSGGIPIIVAILRKSLFSPTICHGLELLSPMYAHSLASGGLIGFERFYFAESLTLVFSLACILLAAASWMAPRTWKQRAKEPLHQRLRGKINAWTSRTIKARSALGRKLLDQNPYEWLSARELSAGSDAWIFLSAWTALAAALILNFNRHNDPAAVQISVCIPICYLIQVNLKCRIGGHAADRFCTDRDVGALELILATPVTIQDMVRGEFRALIRLFLLPALVVIGLLALGYVLSLGGLDALSGLFNQAPDSAYYRRCGLLVCGALIFFLALDSLALAWTAMWCSLRVSNTGRAGGLTTSLVLFGPIILFAAMIPPATQFATFRNWLEEHGFTTTFVLMTIICLVSNFSAILHCRKRLVVAGRKTATAAAVHSRDVPSPFAWLGRLNFLRRKTVAP